MRTLGIVVGSLLALLTSLLYIPFRWRPVGIFLFVPKMAVSALASFIAMLGLVLSLVGLARRSLAVFIPAGLATLGAGIAVMRIRTAPSELGRVFGNDWEKRVPAERKARMIPQRWSLYTPESPEPRWQRDVPFATVPGTDRTLLCDIWQPSAETASSGLGVIYLHGSAWYFLDKDLGTRPMFRHLAAQGHLIMDVAYRHFPEADIPGMVGDVKRAVKWLKQNAQRYGVRPDRIVLAGGSSGAHLALLTAYAPDHPDLTPSDLAETGLTVSGVISLYGQADLAAMYRHTSQHLVTTADDPKPEWNAPPPAWITRVFGPDSTRLGLQKMMVAGRCDWLIGGTPDEVPECYALVSPIHHVHPGCPPTLLIHGAHDMMAPVDSTQEMYRKLLEAGVPVAFTVLPHTDHAFDMLFWRWSPPAQVAIYEIERFLALLADKD